MSYAPLAFGIDQSVMDRLKQIGPKCWSADMGECNDGDRPSYPNCAEMTKISEEHEEEYDKWRAALPYCPQSYEGNYTFLPPGYKGVAIAAAGAAVIGLVAGYFFFGG
jgi:hypothetical protein